LIWFLSDLARLTRERAAIEQLERQNGPWLKNVHWRLASRLLEVDADIEVNGNLFPITLKYPYVFPSCPPSVLPRATKTRWSYHQYGKGGELCLEWGADNWNSDITGADMIESAHRLLQLENPTPQEEEQQAEIPSRDAFSFAQTLRGASNRFIITPALLVRLLDMPIYTPARIKVCLTGVLESRGSVTSLEMDGASPWRDDLIPSVALDGLTYNGAAIHLPQEAPAPPLQGDHAALLTSQ
jgi:ubiquitin-protein ligase